MRTLARLVELVVPECLVVPRLFDTGALIVPLGRLDTRVFAAGIGECSADLRERSCTSRAQLDIDVDPAASAADMQIVSAASRWPSSEPTQRQSPRAPRSVCCTAKAALDPDQRHRRARADDESVHHHSRGPSCIRTFSSRSTAAKRRRERSTPRSTWRRKRVRN
ncbi:hypothetical protein KTD17_00380 [Burkholderia multivorans]|uniref:hypothetical protein n=1 Tax=Burkholderia multivorans TaxID=87883 RepID=UPI001C226DAF|nr:hypothetical protein [Burkholderia multivorans]MBU9131443.1 hypothetical protein [Burkholderia multivorans]